MLRTLPSTRDSGLAYRLAGIAMFTLITVVSARISIPMDPVPFTFQPLAVLLAGMVLGGRDGALSQLAYLALIAVNLPVDANLRGAAAFVGPTAGYLIGFVVAAGVTGWLVEKGHTRLWQRWLAGVAGVAVIYLCGAVFLKVVIGLDWPAVWTGGVTPFLIPDLAKALIAAALAEGGRAVLMRYTPGV